MINKEKIRELVSEIKKFTYDESKVEVIEKWLEQNQPKPAVVGLSDDQINDLCNVIADNIMEGGSYCDDMNDVITKWQKFQSFSLPSEVPVGLTLAQIKGFGEYVHNHGASSLKLQTLLSDFLKTQSFVKPPDVAIDVAAYDKRINELVEENQRLERLTGSLHDSLHDLLEQLKTPLIKPKQKWMYKQNGDYYVVTDVQIIKGLSKFDNIWIEDQLLISYVAINDEPLSNAQVYTRPFIQFISKFERFPD